MRVLHYYTKADTRLSDYVAAVGTAMEQMAEVVVCCTARDLRRQLRHNRPDIIHLHGCWSAALASAALMAWRAKISYCLSPHGQLEPWIMRQDFWRDKLPKRLLFQKRIVRHAFAVIVQGKMEERCLADLGWNGRIETVPNPIVTETVTPVEAARQLLFVYRKVLDSNTLWRMTIATRAAMASLIKAGQTRDERWLRTDERQQINDLTTDQWRQIRLLAYYEGIEDTLAASPLYGPTDESLHQTACYLPPRPVPVAPMKGEGFTALLKTARHLTATRRITLSNLLQLSDYLRHTQLDDQKVADRMDQEAMERFAAELMAALAEWTALEEGLMPVEPKEGKLTRRIRRLIEKHLKVI